MTNENKLHNQLNDADTNQLIDDMVEAEQKDASELKTKKWQAKTGHSDSTESSNNDKLQELTNQLLETRDLLLREKAENDNLRRRHQRETEDNQKYAITAFARDMIEVRENLDRAIHHMPKQTNDQEHNVLEGVNMTLRILDKLLHKHGITRLHPLHQEFDHQHHQAITHIVHEQPINHIVEVIQSGYTIHDRLLRPALVVVSKGASE